jgi:hypothetical protein
MRKERSDGGVLANEMSVLLIIIPSVWLTTAALVVLLCRGAARADEALYEHRRGERDQRAEWPAEGPLVLCERRERRISAAPLRARDDRARGGRCATGS